MIKSLEVLFSPAEFRRLARRDLSDTVCVVFDILRATSTMMTILKEGGEAIIPVGEIEEALALRRKDSGVLLAGERHGVRILHDQTGGVDFDYGNSPREFMAAALKGRAVAMTTTNGTRALRACVHAKKVYIGSFLGLSALAARLIQERHESLLLVCSGTVEETSFEDTLCAGALCEKLVAHADVSARSDSAEIARLVYEKVKGGLLASMQHARNGRRLLNLPDLRDDVPCCLTIDSIDFVAELTQEGRVVKSR